MERKLEFFRRVMLSRRAPAADMPLTCAGKCAQTVLVCHGPSSSSRGSVTGTEGGSIPIVTAT
jgi:hypothetical protein